VSGPTRDELALRLARDLPDSERAEAFELLAPFEEVTAALERAGERVRVQDWRAGEPVPGEERALAALESALAPQRPRRSRWVGVGLAAAALLVAVLFVRELLPTDKNVPDGLFVGTSSYNALAPVGEVDDFGTFRWDGALPPNGFYQVAVWGAADDVGTQPRTLSGELSEASWAPDPTVAEGWPDAIRWQVRVYEWSRTQIDDVTASARRPAR
jgi:hypothetical protein